MEAFHESVKDVEVTAEAARPVGTVGAVVSRSSVVTDKGADGTDTLLAASKAETVKEYSTPAKSPVIGPVTSCPSISTWKALFANSLLARISMLYWALAATLMV